MNKDPLVVSLRYPKAPHERRNDSRDSEPAPIKRSSRWKTVSIVLFVLALLGVGAGIMWQQDVVGKMFEGEAETPAEVQAQIDDVVAAVGKLIVLPEGEEPTVATVTDPEKLKDQPFFANAKEGHKVLLYTKSRKAFLFDPVANKLIEVAPITTDITP